MPSPFALLPDSRPCKPANMHGAFVVKNSVSSGASTSGGATYPWQARTACCPFGRVHGHLAVDVGHRSWVRAGGEHERGCRGGCGTSLRVRV